jgi:hypothetical protein
MAYNYNPSHLNLAPMKSFVTGIKYLSIEKKGNFVWNLIRIEYWVEQNQQNK